MKKVLALVAVLAMLVSAFALTAHAAEPALLITPEMLADSGNTFGSCTAEVATEGDLTYAHVETTADDPWIVLKPAVTTDVANKYVAIKYRTTADDSCVGGSLYAKIDEPHADFELVKDGAWHTTVCDVSLAAPSIWGPDSPNTCWTGEFNRLDVLNGSPLNPGQEIDIAFVAFFANEADANAYDGSAAGQPATGLINESEYDVSYVLDSSNAQTWTTNGNIGNASVKYFFKAEDDGVKVAIRALGVNAGEYMQLNFNPGNKLAGSTGQFLSFVTGDSFKLLQHNHKNGVLDDANPNGADISDKVDGQIAAIDGGYEIVAKLPKALFTITDVEGADSFVYGQDDLYFGMFIVTGGQGYTNQSTAPGADWTVDGLGLTEYVLRGQPAPQTQPQTGDATVAVFAVLAVLAMGAAVVFAKKRSF